MLKTFYNSKQSTGGGSSSGGMGQMPYAHGGNQHAGGSSSGTKRAI